jgi:hypothetical protein
VKKGVVTREQVFGAKGLDARDVSAGVCVWKVKEEMGWDKGLVCEYSRCLHARTVECAD